MSVYLVLNLSAWYVLVKFLYCAETKHFDRLSFSRMGFLQKMTLMLDPGWLNHGLLPSDWKGSNLWTDEIESSHQSMTHQSLTTSNIVSYSFTAPLGLVGVLRRTLYRSKSPCWVNLGARLDTVEDPSLPQGIIRGPGCVSLWSVLLLVLNML